MQKYITDSDGYASQIRFKVDINEKSEFIYHATTIIRKTIQNTTELGKTPLDSSGVVDFDSSLYEREPNDLEYKDKKAEKLISKFISKSNLKSCYMSFECLVIDGEYYINDTSSINPLIRNAFTKVDGINYVEDYLKWQYGLLTGLPRNFSRMAAGLDMWWTAQRQMGSLSRATAARLHPKEAHSYCPFPLIK